MIDINPVADGPMPLVDRSKKTRPRLWPRVTLGLVMLISIFMNFYQLGQNGFGNLYYAAGIRSMADSLHNFFFVSYDPGGFVTIDKPPLGFWLQVISVKIFGFTPFSIFLPQALAGVLAVLVLYVLVRRHFGVVAGLLAALALAVSPISVVTNRNNTIDSTLALTMLLGAWAIMRAAETGKWRWLLLCAVSVGLGFNIKMLEAYLVVPAFGLLYLLAAPRKLWIRIIQLTVAILVMLAVSLSWAIAVDLTPASQRPYVGSSQNNSEISLALGYNGTQRLLGGGPGIGGSKGPGRFPRTGGFPGNNPDGFPGNNPGSNLGGFPGNNPGGFPGSSDFSGNPGSGAPPFGFNGGGGFLGGGNGMFNTGTAGPLRLFNEPLGSQIVWLLPIAILGMLALAWQRRPQFRDDHQQQSLILWGTWLLTMGIFFSVAGFFHQYYLTVFAPAICALFGIGIVVMWQDYRRRGWRGWLLPVALLVTVLEQVHIINSNTGWGVWLIPLIIIPCGLAALALILARLTPEFRFNVRVPAVILCIGVAALLLTPTVWSAVPALQNVVSDLPIAGPDQQSRFAGFGGNNTVDSKLISYLEANQGNTTYLLATANSQSADSLILATNKPVMALGGFGGSDPILTTDQLASLVSNGTVRFFLLNGPQNRGPSAGGIPTDLPQGIPGGPGGNQSSLTNWVQQNCSVVSSSQWQSSTSTSDRGFGGPGGGMLYDCKS